MTDQGSEDRKTHLAFDNKTTARGPFLILLKVMQLQPTPLTPCAVCAVDVHAAKRMVRPVLGLFATHDAVSATDCGATCNTCGAPVTATNYAVQLLSPPPDAML